MIMSSNYKQNNNTYNFPYMTLLLLLMLMFFIYFSYDQKVVDVEITQNALVFLTSIIRYFLGTNNIITHKISTRSISFTLGLMDPM